MQLDLAPKNYDLVLYILGQFVSDNEVWAFGSRVTGTARKYSDLDIAIINDCPLPLSITADLNNAFSESDLPIKVDVVDYAACDESFQIIIKTNHIVIKEAI